MNNGSHEKLLTKAQVDEVFSFTRPQWEAGAAVRFVPMGWHVQFSRHDTGLQVIGYEPLTGFGFSVQPLYANDTDPPIMVIIRNYFLPGKIAANDGAVTEGPRSSRPAFTWTTL